MDLGATICRPKNPDCANCPLAENCIAHLEDRTSELPKKSPKRPKKQWTGHAYIIETPEGIAFEKREDGLLGNMYGLPSTMGEAVEFDPPFKVNWENLGEIYHVFTHIHLALTIWRIRLDRLPPNNVWVTMNKQTQKGTASLWRKALKLSEENHGES